MASRYHFTMKKWPRDHCWFDSYEKAIQEKVRLKVCDNISTSAIRVGLAKDFDITARQFYPIEFASYLSKTKRKLTKADKNLRRRMREEENKRQQECFEKNEARREQQRMADEVQNYFVSQRKLIDMQLMSGKITDSEYFDKVKELDTIKETV